MPKSCASACFWKHTHTQIYFFRPPAAHTACFWAQNFTLFFKHSHQLHTNLKRTLLPPAPHLIFSRLASISLHASFQLYCHTTANIQHILAETVSNLPVQRDFSHACYLVSMLLGNSLIPLVILQGNITSLLLEIIKGWIKNKTSLGI